MHIHHLLFSQLWTEKFNNGLCARFSSLHGLKIWRNRSYLINRRREWTLRPRQECIPVGCVPSAAVAITGGGSPPPWEQTPLEQAPLGANTPRSRPPPMCAPGKPPRPDPLNFPHGCGPGDLPWPDPPQLPPWMWAWRLGLARSPSTRSPGDLLQGMLWYHLQCKLE